MNERGVSARDFVVGIAASGTTPYVIGALVRAKALGGQTAIVACSELPAELHAVLDVAIVPIVGPEVVTGSTRMKAGTATKLVLNTISTGAMIRLGKTYGNLMVDLRATNAKLADRAVRIVCEVCHVTRAEAQAVLERAGGNVKSALVMQLLGVSLMEAEERLRQAGGVIRRVVLGGPPPVADD
jgi:N-acetylmuramic acid 6-phosphate etherase